ncbi:hypothetical protein [Chitinophaga barathri]|uniref:RHS repeat protein n=1 Tax=Chitinophaga barathri TaxID=1647451 RepID=A0A3N4MU92_9BACT|nr:hypothetical protein [Chitinophaga barathri]RPD43129.1 hypothetical protein EG028_02205 [Chitinophaga barathri]
MKKKIIHFLFAIVATLPLSAQIPEPLRSIPTPNAFSFQEYGKHDVSHFSGTPDIRVPLANIAVKTGSIDMSLSYNATGFRPDVHASWVGTNWNLNLGGVITRQVNGLPDEFSYFMNNYCNCISYMPNNVSATYNSGFAKRTYDTSYNVGYLMNATNHFLNLNPGSSPMAWTKYSPPVPYKGYWYNNSCIAFDKFWKDTPFGNLPNNDDYYDGTKDLQSDEYSFNVMGHSGKFMFKSDATIEVISNRKYQVAILRSDDTIPGALLKPNADPQAGSTCPNWVMGFSPWKAWNRYPKTRSGFRITADDGTQFDFGSRYAYLNAVDYSIAERYMLGQNGHGQQDFLDYWQATSWYLASVKFPDGKKVYFEYDRAEYTRAMYLSEFSYGIQQGNSGCPIANANYTLPGNIVQSKIQSPVYLSRVYSDLLDIRLFYSNTGESNALTQNAIQDFKWKKLDSVRFIDNEGQGGVWRFRYYPLVNYSQRLFLSNVEKFSHTGQRSGELYRFLYDTTLTLPDYLTGRTDHWGYWNGIDTRSVIGKTNAALDTLRKAVLANTRAGLLTHLFYPTGGYTQFTYELNTYSKRVKLDRTQGVDLAGGNQKAGGLRIRRIRTVDTLSGIDTYSDYYYVTGYTNLLSPAAVEALPSSGVHNINSFVYHWTDQVTRMFNDPICLQNMKISLTSNQPLNPVFDDGYVGYTTVIERQRDSSYKKYTYSNHDNGYVDDPVDATINPWSSPYNQFSKRTQDRGNLLEEASFNSKNAIVQRISTQYAPISATPLGGPRSFFKHITIVSLDATSWNASFPNPAPINYLVSSRIKVYSYRMLPSRITTTNFSMTTGDSITTVREHAYDNLEHGQLTSVIDYDSDGSITREIMKYPRDYAPTTVLTNLVNDHRISTVLEKLRTFKASAGADEKVTEAVLTEYALNPAGTYELSLVKTAYKAEIDNPFNLSTMTATVPSSNGWKSSSVWTKDSRYKTYLKIDSVDRYNNITNFVAKKEPRMQKFFGFGGLKELGSFEVSPSRSIWSPAYTSFETIVTRDAADDYSTTRTMLDDSTWLPIGTFSTTYSFTGKQSFVGRARYNGPVWIQGTIYVAARTGGAAPTLERYTPGPNTYTPLNVPDSIVGYRDGWTIYRFYYSNAATVITVNSNGNYIDELRMGAREFGDDQTFQTCSYVDGRISEITNHLYQRERYHYDAWGRLIRVVNEDKTIKNAYSYQLAGPNQ